MFALPVFEMTHPRYKKSFEMSMDGMRIAESENFIYAKVSGNIIQAYTKDTHLNCFTIDFKDREVTTHNTDESRDDTHIQLAKLPEDLNMDNFTNWIESTHQESWF